MGSPETISPGHWADSFETTRRGSRSTRSPRRKEAERSLFGSTSSIWACHGPYIRFCVVAWMGNHTCPGRNCDSTLGLVRGLGGHDHCPFWKLACINHLRLATVVSGEMGGSKVERRQGDMLDARQRPSPRDGVHWQQGLVGSGEFRNRIFSPETRDALDIFNASDAVDWHPDQRVRSQAHAWFLVGIGGIGMLQNILEAGTSRQLSASGFQMARFARASTIIGKLELYDDDDDATVDQEKDLEELEAMVQWAPEKARRKPGNQLSDVNVIQPGPAEASAITRWLSSMSKEDGILAWLEPINDSGKGRTPQQPFGKGQKRRGGTRRERQRQWSRKRSLGFGAWQSTCHHCPVLRFDGP